MKSSALQFTSEQWQRIGVGVAYTGFLVLIALSYYIGYGPGDTRDVAGEVISFETTANNSAPDVRYFLHVRLDNGLTVRAQVSPHVTAKVGRRVRLIATKMPVVGIERYQFKEFLDSLTKDNSLLLR